MTIKPIETHYNGYRFRSRLEARWAVFFDAVGIPYRYEFDGFPLNGLWYLPDFWLPMGDCGCGNWIEIKPTWPTSQECEKAIRLCVAKRQAVYILAGDVWPDEYRGIVFVPINPEGVEELKEMLQACEPPIHWMSPTRAIWLVEEGESIFTVDLERYVMSFPTFFVQCPTCQAVFLINGMQGCKCGVEEYEHASPFLRSAYTSARHARFERGR